MLLDNPICEVNTVISPCAFIHHRQIRFNLYRFVFGPCHQALLNSPLPAVLYICEIGTRVLLKYQKGHKTCWRVSGREWVLDWGSHLLEGQAILA